MHINLLKNVFNYETPDKMLKHFHNLETIDAYNQATYLTEESFTDFKDEVEIMSEGDKKTRE